MKKKLTRQAKTNIDKWIASLSVESIEVIKPVIKVLGYTDELNTHLLYVPYDDFEKEGIGTTVQENVLIRLWRLGVIELVDHTQGNNVTSWNPDYMGDNMFTKDTALFINYSYFDYLKSQLVSIEEGVSAKRDVTPKLMVGDLYVNPELYYMQYKDEKAFKMNPKYQYNRFLVLLIENKPELVKYINIAKELSISDPDNILGTPEESNIDFSRQIAQIKKDLMNFLKRHLDNIAYTKTDSAIVNIEGEGYKVTH